MKVRRDVIDKLLTGLKEKREYAVEHNATIPKYYEYSTPKANHWIHYNDEEKYVALNSRLYDGTRCHTVLEMEV